VEATLLIDQCDSEYEKFTREIKKIEAQIASENLSLKKNSAQKIENIKKLIQVAKKEINESNQFFGKMKPALDKTSHEMSKTVEDIINWGSVIGVSTIIFFIISLLFALLSEFTGNISHFSSSVFLLVIGVAFIIYNLIVQQNMASDLRKFFEGSHRMNIILLAGPPKFNNMKEGFLLAVEIEKSK